MESAKERRKAARTSSNVALDIYDSRGRMVVAEGRFLNLSTTGGLLESLKPLKPRSSVRIHMAPAKKSALEIVGRIVWARKNQIGFKYGVRFIPRKP